MYWTASPRAYNTTTDQITVSTGFLGESLQGQRSFSMKAHDIYSLACLEATKVTIPNGGKGGLISAHVFTEYLFAFAFSGGFFYFSSCIFMIPLPILFSFGFFCNNEKI